MSMLINSNRKILLTNSKLNFSWINDIIKKLDCFIAFCIEQNRISRLWKGKIKLWWKNSFKCFNFFLRHFSHIGELMFMPQTYDSLASGPLTWNYFLSHLCTKSRFLSFRSNTLTTQGFVTKKKISYHFEIEAFFFLNALENYTQKFHFSSFWFHSYIRNGHRQNLSKKAIYLFSY